MLITPDFVFIQSAKTGTSTLRDSLMTFHHERLENRRLTKKISDWAAYQTRRGYPYCTEITGQGTAGRHKHLNVSDIPPSVNHLPVVSSIRHPDSWIVSHYTYGDWKRKLNQVGLNQGQENSIDLFLEYSNRQTKRYSSQRGFYSWAFLVQHVVNNPDNTTRSDLLKSISKIHWIRMEAMKEDFNEVQTQLNMPAKYGGFIPLLPKVNSSKAKATDEEKRRLSDYMRNANPLLYEIYEAIASKAPPSVQ